MNQRLRFWRGQRTCTLDLPSLKHALYPLFYFCALHMWQRFRKTTLASIFRIQILKYHVRFWVSSQNIPYNSFERDTDIKSWQCGAARSGSEVSNRMAQRCRYTSQSELYTETSIANFLLKTSCIVMLLQNLHPNAWSSSRAHCSGRKSRMYNTWQSLETANLWAHHPPVSKVEAQKRARLQ